MATIHRLKYEGYSVGDRLLEDVYFAVILEVEGAEASILGVEPWDEAEAAYLKDIKLEAFIPKIKAAVQSRINYFKESYAEVPGSFEQDFAQWEEETGEAGVQLLVEG